MIVDGTSYHDDTSPTVVDILEQHRKPHRYCAEAERLHIRYGDGATGQDWGDEWDVEGYISRSTGQQKIPLLVPNARSIGGLGILDHCIVAIRTTIRPYKLLYCHPSYRFGDVTVGPSKFAGVPFGAFVDGENRANFRTEAQRNAWIEKMTAVERLHLGHITRALAA